MMRFEVCAPNRRHFPKVDALACAARALHGPPRDKSDQMSAEEQRFSIWERFSKAADPPQAGRTPKLLGGCGGAFKFVILFFYR